MDVIELVIRGQDKVVALACGKCNTIYDLRFEQAARECCDLRCRYCDAPAPKGWISCEACRKALEQDKEKRAVEKAEKVLYSDYKGQYLFHDAFPGEGFIEADIVGDVLLEMEPEDRPAYAWACRTMPMPNLDAADLIENAFADFPEEAVEYLGHETLQDALDTWIRDQPQDLGIEPDHGTAVLLHEIAVEEFENEADA